MPSYDHTERHNPSALYIHIPFCVFKCGYCDFNSQSGATFQTMEACTRAIEKEIRDLKNNGLKEPLTSIFIGGGTPTHLPEKLLSTLLETITQNFEFSNSLEFTVEANPESSTKNKLSLLKKAGVNRISFGVQATQAKHLAFLDRSHSIQEVDRAISTAKSLGLENCNIDLIHSFPGLTLKEWEETLFWTLQRTPKHISCYELTFEPSTTLYRKKQKGEVQEQGNRAKLKFLETTRQILSENNFNWYEVSNFSLDGFECQHNLNYWAGGNYCGVGPGASKHSDGIRKTNIRSVKNYILALKSTGNAEFFGEVLSPEKQCAEAIWLGLRLRGGADLTRIKLNTGINPLGLIEEKLVDALENGFCHLLNDKLILTDKGVLVADHLAERLLT